MADKTIVLITGGNTGIGFEVIKVLVGESSIPYTILMGSRSLDKAETAISKIQKEYPDSKSDIVSLQVDIESDDSILSAFRKVEKEHGKIDVLINNAGKVLPFNHSCPSSPKSQIKLIQAPHTTP